ncbi:MAG: ABC transmembrane type-1 domain-containing protein [Oscillospiraceae bacterium]|jgi:multiple sugar transport system permease protein
MKKTLSNRKETLSGWLLNVPFIVYSIVFFLIPLIWAIWLSTLNWNMMSPNKTFVGLQNFKNMFTNKSIRAAFINSFRYLVPIVILCFIVALILALLVSSLPDKIKGIVAVLFFIPYLTSGVATSVIIRFLFSYNSSLNVFLRQKFDINIDWFQNPHSAFWIIVFIIVWKMSGYYALFLLSAIESIGPEVNEACALDGSYGWHKLTHITLPIILPTLTTVIVLAAGLSFGIYTEPFLLTGGGPNNATTTWLLEIYKTSFTNFRSGQGAAIAIANAVQIFAVIQLITVVMNKLNNKFGC